MTAIFRGLGILLAVVFIVGTVFAIVFGPIWLGETYNNPWFLALYIPHALLALYVLGSEGLDHRGVSGPETLI